MNNQTRSLTAIVAATSSNGIGKDGGLPWRLSNEMKYFQKVTVGVDPSSSMNTLIMGRITWESIPLKFRPLKDRKNIIVSRKGVDLNPDTPNTSIHSSLESAIASIPTSSRAFLMGGAQLYNQALTSSPPLVDRVLLTRITTEVDCDTFLTDFQSFRANAGHGKKLWKLASHKDLEEYVGFEVQEGEIEEKGFKYRFEMWVLAE